MKRILTDGFFILVLVLTVSLTNAQTRDYGDAPNSYFTTSASSGPSHLPSAYNATSKTGSLMLGTRIDVESDGVPGTLSTGDDLADMNDEDAIRRFPLLIPGSTSYSVTLTVRNITGADATVNGWIDFNRNGTFDAGELATATVVNGATSVTLNWSGFAAVANFGYMYARFRIASNASEIALPTGPANSGEVEDYRFFIGRPVSGKVFNDVNRNTIIDGSEGTATLPSPLYVYVVQSNVVVDSARVAADGTYALRAPAGQTSTLELSALQYAIGYNTSSTPINHALPAGWVTTGENGNGNNTGPGDLSPDGILSIGIPNGTTSLTQRNFGIACKTAGSNRVSDICASEISVIPLYDMIWNADAGGIWTYASGTGINFDATAGTIQMTGSATNSTFEYHMPAVAGCAATTSIATIIVKQTPVTYRNVTVCEGGSVCITNPVINTRRLGSEERICHNVSGVYYDTLSTASEFGCDSVVVTTLTVMSAPTFAVTHASCNGIGSVVITAPVGSGVLYSKDNINFQTSPYFPALTAGNHTFYVKSSIDTVTCSYSASVNILTTVCSPQYCSSELYWNDSDGNIGYYDLANNVNVTRCNNSDVILGDIAIDQYGQMWGVGFYTDSLYRINPNTCDYSRVAKVPLSNPNSLSVLPDGTFLVGSGTYPLNPNVYRYDPISNNFTLWHTFDSGFPNGDYIFLNGFIYVLWVNTVTNTANIYKVAVDASYNYISHTDLGAVLDFSYGLAKVNGELYAVSSANPTISGGTLIHIPLPNVTDWSVVYSSPEQYFYGATSYQESNDVDEPLFSVYSINNTCPVTTADLNTLTATTPMPDGGTLVWFTNNTYSGTALTPAEVAAAGPGTYYAYYYFPVGANGCYSKVSAPVTVTSSACLDLGNLPVAGSGPTIIWPQATATLLSLDLSNTSRAWLGGNNSYPNKTNDPNVDRNGGLAISSDDIDVFGAGTSGNPFSFTGFDWRQSAFDIQFNITVNGNAVSGDKTVYYGLWFDANGNGSFTDADDIFVTGNLAYDGPQTAVIAAPFRNGGTNAGASTGAIRLVATKDNTTFTKAQNGDVNVINGEVEDYYVVYPMPLSVNLKSFTAIKQAESAVLSWSTVSESNNKGFEVQRSTDGVSWKQIAFVGSKGAGGNSTMELSYSLTDKAPFKGINYYRLKQVDTDGRFEYSVTRQLNFSNGSSLVRLYPNPAKTVINISGVETGSVIRIDDALGKTVLTSLRAADVQAAESINISGLSKGIYLLVITGKDGSSVTHKLIKD
ncbi:GEVED domain-containing protein [Polluticaenibacter yanchengensis]|uniref:GEVED domain-containing protein n=1 Tax=Polluticaenibacter yanchengensis TaxID=3014562 RepID=A0ABT4UKB3_9BACT|nr:GEVED domain-containing protein [Chitinophagaceae bacterium LY-5]